VVNIFEVGRRFIEAKYLAIFFYMAFKISTIVDIYSNQLTMICQYSTFAIDSIDTKIKNREGFFDRSSINTIFFYQSIGLILDNPKWEKELSKTHKK